MASVDDIKNYLQAGGADKNYEITDSNGNFVGFTPEKSGQNWSEEARLGYAPIYKTDKGWTSTPEVSVSINEKTGNIDVKAPKSWFENESFKATYNSNFLKQMAQAYKADKDTKIPDPDDSSKSWSIPDLVAEYDKGLKDYANQQVERENIRQQIRKLTGNNALADGLTEQDFIFMGSTGTGENDTDNTLISIPNFQGSNLLNRVRELQGFNTDFSQISRGQFKELYNVSKSSRDDIIQLVVSLSTHLQKLANKEDITADDITEYARTQALINYITKNEPEQGFWEQLGISVEAIAEQGLSGAATPGGNLLSFLEGAGNILNWLSSPRAVPITIDGDIVGYRTDLYGSVKDTPNYSTMVRDDIDAQRQSEQQQLEEIAYINKNAAALGTLAKIGGEIGANYFMGKFTGTAVEAGTSWLSNQAILGSLSQSLNELGDIGEVLTASQSAQVTMGVPQAARTILEVAKTSPSSLLSGTNLLLNVLHTAGQGQEVAKIVNSAVKAVNTASAVSKWAGFFSQLLVDVAAYDANVFRDVVENSDTKDLGELLWTIASDATIFAGAGIVMGLANKFPKTKTAQRWNTYATKGITKAEVVVENTKENLKSVVLRNDDYLSSIKSISKRQVGEANSLIRQAKQAVASAEGLQATEEAIDNLVALQNVVNEGKSVRAGIEQGLISYDIAPTFAPRYYEAVDATQNIINAVKESGITIPKVNLKDKGVSVLDTLIPQSVNDYIGALYQYRQLGTLKILTPAQQTRYDDVKAYTEQFEQDYPNLATKLADTLPTWIAAYRGLDEYNIANGLVDKEMLAEMGQSPLFSQGYMRVQTLEEFENAQDDIAQLTLLATKNPTKLAMDSYEWGHMSHFKNPMSVLESAMLQSARVQEARTKLERMTNKGIAPKKTVVSATDYRRANTVKALKTNFQKQVKEEFKGLKENISNSGLVRQTIENVLQHSDYLKQAGKAKTSGAKVTRAKTAPLKVTAVDKRAYVDSLPDAQISTLALQHNGATFTDILPDEFNEAIKGKTKLRNEIKDAIAANAAFIGWDDSLGVSSDKIERIKALSAEEFAQLTVESVVKVNYENFVKASQFDPTLATRLDRMSLSSNKEYLGLKTVTEEIEKTKRARQIAKAENLWQQDLDKLAELSGLDKTGRDQVIADFNDLITEYIYTGVQGNEASRKTLDALVANESDPDLAKEYIVLSELYDYRKNLDGALRKQISGLARQQFQIYNASVPKDKRLNENKFLNTFMDLFDDTLYQRRNDAMHQLQDLESEMIDHDKVYKEINDLNDIIKEAGKTPLPGRNALVESINANGQTEIYEVSPTVADLVKYDPTNVPRTWFQGFMSNKAFEVSHRLFRFSTTTFNAGSFMNQAWRDSLDSYLATGTLMPMSFTEQQIVDNFGSRVAEEYRIKHPELYSQLETRAKETGRSIEEQVVRYASARGEVLAKGTTETAASRLDTSKNAWDKTRNVAGKVLEKAEYLAGGFREEYFRKSNYEAALYSALAENKSLDTAIEWATRIARDATTDFSRITYHLQAFTSTIPYLRAGVNGTKSFFRLLSLDPVGVGCRLIGGFIIPVMAATLSCLKDEDNKKYYKTLKEYEKEDQLIFAVNGEFFSIPLPQGVGAFVSPMRHLVEALSDGNQHDFWELALNDFFNVLPYNMGAFMDIDGNVLASDPTLLDRVGLEAMSLLSTFSPNIVKTIFELTYGIDPYTGKPINKSYWVIDENGDRVLMDSTQSEFAQWLGQITGGSASVIATLIEDLVGKTSLDLLDSLTALMQYAINNGQEGSLTTLPERIIGGMAGKLTVNEYNHTKSQWNQQISNLYNQKEALRQGYVEYTEKINSATTAEEREKYIAKRADHIAGFMSDIKTLVDNLVAQGGTGIDSYRIATLVSLVNWYETPTGQTNAYSRYLTDEEKQLGKQEARRTIERLGITTTPDQSMLGYTYRDSKGEVQVKFYTPMEILNAQSIYYTSVDIFKTELVQLMDEAGLGDKWTGYYNLNSKAERKQYMADWNKKAVKAMSPYLQKYGVKTVLRNQEIAEALDDYFFTDTYYNAKNYLQEIFGE